MAESNRAPLRSKARRSLHLIEPAALEILPLPWPESIGSRRHALRPHSHRCVSCSTPYRCGGPDETGECPPVCGPCMWVELGVQLKQYQSTLDAIVRRRRKLEEQAGAAACRKAQLLRRNVQRGRYLLAGFGHVMLEREDRISTGEQSPEGPEPPALGHPGNEFSN